MLSLGGCRFSNWGLPRLRAAFGKLPQNGTWSVGLGLLVGFRCCAGFGDLDLAKKKLSAKSGCSSWFDRLVGINSAVLIGIHMLNQPQIMGSLWGELCFVSFLEILEKCVVSQMLRATAEVVWSARDGQAELLEAGVG